VSPGLQALLAVLPIGQMLRFALDIRRSNILDTGVTASTQPLYLPATLLLVTVAVTYFLHQMSRDGMGRAVDRRAAGGWGRGRQHGRHPQRDGCICHGENRAETE
jgi:L-lactate permease